MLKGVHFVIFAAKAAFSVMRNLTKRANFLQQKLALTFVGKRHAFTMQHQNSNIHNINMNKHKLNTYKILSWI